ncbi:hypothetical protein PIROE2DRAFT_61546 [Piromyces sp. E2]|nr:hypothetical protein PIROE2DRAFT_61546 [Piromyces sp. E2]|eukprot:OUM62994.1 hypothetical protein PIROE2DRAFT_61546 [Piromyces sp. E2]
MLAENLIPYSDVLEEIVEFLKHHSQETIIMHLNNENIPKVNGEELDISEIIYNHIKKYPSDFFYTDQNIPTLLKVRGNKISWNNMSNCLGYNNNNGCCPRISVKNNIKNLFLVKNFSYRIQDVYNLDRSKKWELVLDVLDNTLFACPNNGNFTDYKHPKVLTINFMSIVRARVPNWSNLIDYLPSIHDLLFDAGIEDTSNYINTKLTKYIVDRESNHPNVVIYNEWIPLDFPFPDVIRVIYQTNGYLNPELTQNKVEISKTEELNILFRDEWNLNKPYNYAIKCNNNNPSNCKYINLFTYEVVKDHNTKNQIQTNFNLNTENEEEKRFKMGRKIMCKSGNYGVI